MMKFLVFALLLVGYAEYAVAIDNINFNRHSSTYEEGVLRGTADLMRGGGDYLRNQAEAQRIRQDAISQAIRNRDAAINSYWYNKQLRRDIVYGGPDWIEQEHKRLDNKERSRELELRREDLREKGVLPPKEDPYIMIRGRKYNNRAEFLNTPDFLLGQLENREAEIVFEMKQFMEQKEHKLGLGYLKWRSSAHPTAVDSYDRHRRISNMLNEPQPSVPFNIDVSEIQIQIDARSVVLQEIRAKIAVVKDHIAKYGNDPIK